MDRNLSIVLSGSSSSIGNSIYALQEDAIQRCPALIVLKEDNNNNNNNSGLLLPGFYLPLLK